MDFKPFLLVFVPLFVAIDPVGCLPLFMGLTEGISKPEKQRLALQAVGTAFLIGIVFGVGGHYLIRLLGITADDFKVAGGLLLVVFSIREIFGESPKQTGGAVHDRFIGVVPLGIPLLAGPAMITTLLILHDDKSFLLILTALLANMLIAWLVFIFSEKIVASIGEVPAKVVGKVVAIFLAAIGVMMIRRGLVAFFIR